MLNSRIVLFVSVLCTVFFVSTQAQDQDKIDSLLNVLKIAKEDTNKVKILLSLDRELSSIDPDTALKLANQALSLSQKVNSKKHIADSYHDIAWANFLMGNYASALDNNYKALSIREGLDDKARLSSSYGNIGNIHKTQGNYPEALDNLLKALKLLEEVGNKKGIATSFGNIGLVYYEQKNYPKALDYCKKGLKLAEEIGYENGVSIHLSNIGLIYYDQGNLTNALDYYLKALEIEERLGNNSSTLLANIGSVYSEQGDDSRALVCYFKVLKMAEEVGDKNLIAVQLANIGFVYIKIGKFSEAEWYLKKSIAISDSIGSLDYLRQFEELLSDLYDTTGRHKLALEHYKKAMVLKDSLFNKEKNEEITRKEMNYEFNKKEAATKSDQDKKDVLAQQELQKQKLLKFSFVGALILVLILFSFIYTNYRTRQKLKLESIRNNIAADLHDDIGSTLNSISLFSEVAKKEAGKEIPALEQIGVSSRKIIDAMSDIVWTINPENDTLENVIARMRSLAYLLLKAKGIEFVFKADDGLNQLSLPMLARKNVYLLFKEATNNIVKYSNAQRASFHITLVDKNVKMVIRDNGVGFDMEHAQMGNGIKNMKRRATEIGAQFLMESTEGSGTNIELSFKT